MRIRARRVTSSTAAFGFALLALLTLTTRAEAQSRPAFFDQPSELREIGEAAGPDEHMPVVVFLAPTGGTSPWIFERIHEAVPFAHYLAVLPPGQPERSDYLPHFNDFVSWMEQRVMTDLAQARSTFVIDDERIYLAGFSLGGDTSWALLARDPEIFRGAVVMGSRSSARLRTGKLAAMRAHHVRVAFAIGAQDDANRVSGIRRSHQVMVDGHIPTRLDTYPGEHVPPPDPEMLAALFRFVMSDTSAASPAATPQVEPAAEARPTPHRRRPHRARRVHRRRRPRRAP